MQIQQFRADCQHTRSIVLLNDNDVTVARYITLNMCRKL